MEYVFVGETTDFWLMAKIFAQEEGSVPAIVNFL